LVRKGSCRKKTPTRIESELSKKTAGGNTSEESASKLAPWIRNCNYAVNSCPIPVGRDTGSRAFAAQAFRLRRQSVDAE